MKKILIMAMTAAMTVSAFGMVGCGREGVSYKDFNAKATALQSTDPGYTYGMAQIEYTGNFGTFSVTGDNFVNAVPFTIDENGSSKLDDIFEYECPSMMLSTLRPYFYKAMNYRYAWEQEELEEKNKKDSDGDIFKDTAVYQIKNELSVKYESYMKIRGTEYVTTSYRNYDMNTGYLTQYYYKSESGGEVTVHIRWNTNT